MKKQLLIIFIALSCVAIKTKAQTVTITHTTTLPSCPSCCDGSFTVTPSGCSGYTVDIMPNFSIGAPTIVGNDWIYANICAGTYSIIVSANLPCSTAVQMCNMNFIATGIENQSQKKDVPIIYPNPIIDRFTTNIEGIKLIDVSDIYGRRFKYINTLENEISLRELSKGIYIISIYSDENALVLRKKVVKE
ncbi:MAG: T9SS type A sorting domain-containing protein [Bacteroidetes bacterium]|nr:T9SS type A sorting domain-containing protein [Bacteroidota bacterium]